MRHFHRTTLRPDAVLANADQYFESLGLKRGAGDRQGRQFAGPLGVMRLVVRMEGGHYTMVEAFTDQVGESRLDKNVKNFFADLHRKAEPRYRIEASY